MRTKVLNDYTVHIHQQIEMVCLPMHQAIPQTIPSQAILIISIILPINVAISLSHHKLWQLSRDTVFNIRRDFHERYSE